MIARTKEGKTSCLPDLSDKAVSREFEKLDRELGIIRRLSEAVAENPKISKNKHTILVFNFEGETRLRVFTFNSPTIAQNEYERFEAALGDTADVVLVRAERAEDLRKAFQNYFSDASDFVDLVKVGSQSLRS